MRGSSGMPPLSELFNENNTESCTSSNLPSLTELLKSNSREASISSKGDGLKLKNSCYAFDRSLPISCNQCGVPSLNELSSDKLNKLNNRVDDHGNILSLSGLGSSPKRCTTLREQSNNARTFLSLKELGDSPGNFASLNELSNNSPGKFVSLNELSNSPGKFTTLNELSNSPGKFTPLTELSNRPGKLSSLGELSSSPGKFTSLDELSNSPGKLRTLADLSNNSGMLSSFNERDAGSCTLPSLQQLSNNVKTFSSLKDLDCTGFSPSRQESSGQNLSMANMLLPTDSLTLVKESCSQKHLNNEVNAEQRDIVESNQCIASTDNEDLNLTTDQKNNESLPSLLSLLAIEKKEDLCDSTSDVKSRSSILLHDELHTFNSKSPLSITDHKHTLFSNVSVEDVSKKLIKKKSYLTKPSKFAQVVGAKPHKNNRSIEKLHNQLKRTYNLTSPTEVLMTDPSCNLGNTQDIFSFATPSPDDIVLSHQEKAYQRDY